MYSAPILFVFLGFSLWISYSVRANHSVTSIESEWLSSSIPLHSIVLKTQLPLNSSFSKSTTSAIKPIETKNLGSSFQNENCATDLCLHLPKLHLNPIFEPEECITTFCYTLHLPSSFPNLTSFQLITSTFNFSFLSMNPSVWSQSHLGVLTNAANQTSGTQRTSCFSLNGHVQVMDSFGYFQFKNGKTCEQKVKVPWKSLGCTSNCILDPHVGNAQCQACPATCYSGAPATVTAQQTCSLKILATPKVTGSPCATLTTRPCTRTCPVDCSFTGPVYQECQANCFTRTAMETGYFVTFPPSGGGRTCNVTQTRTSRTCSLSSTKITQCPTNCVVTGTPSVPCASLCYSNTKQAVHTVTFGYPTTLHFPQGEGRPCPTFSTTCDCRSCLIGPTPTSKGPCSATCLSFQNNWATGLQEWKYPLLLGSIQGWSNPCQTHFARPCSISCPCRFIASSSLGRCIPTTTFTRTTPWTVSGFQKFTATGSVTACNTIVDVPCSFTLKPTDCSVLSECPTCSCRPTTGPRYLLIDTLVCRSTTLTSSFFGGQPCPTSTSPFTCSQSCPGCDYASPICNCAFSTTRINATYSDVTYFSGYKTCQATLLSTPSFMTTLNGVQCDSNQVSSYTDQLCVSTVFPNRCVHTLSACRSRYSETLTQQVPWTVVGEQVCTYTDIRTGMDRPSSCTPTISSTPIRSTLSPVDCSWSTLCQRPNTPICSSPGLVELTKTCVPLTMTKATYGGTPCSMPSELLRFTSTTHCPPTPTPTTPIACLNPTLAAYHVVFLNSVNISNTFVEGRLAIFGHAQLIHVDIGLKLAYPLPVCLSLPSLFVQGDVYHLGHVYNGDLWAQGSCSTSNEVQCQRKCGVSCTCSTLHYTDLDTWLQRLQWQLASFSETFTLPDFKGTNRSLEVLHWNSTIQPFPHQITFSGEWALDFTLVVNVWGKHIVFPTFPIDLQLYASRILYNFLEAETILFKGVEFYGTILARNATLRGSSLIVGQVYAKSMEMYQNDYALKFKFSNFIGKCSLPA